MHRFVHGQARDFADERQRGVSTLPPPWPKLSVVSRPWRMVALFLFSDAFSLLVAVGLSILIRSAFTPWFQVGVYWKLLPFIPVLLLGFYAAGLYPGVIRWPAEELRRIAIVVSLLYLTLASMTFLLKGGAVYSRAVFFSAWGLTLVFVPFSRSLVRGIFSRFEWWGFPVAVLGAGQTGQVVIKSLLDHPAFGLRPVVAFDDNPDKWGDFEGVVVTGGLSQAVSAARFHHISHAVVAMPKAPRDKLVSVVERVGAAYPHLIVVPNLFGLSSLWVKAKDLGGMLGLETHQQLLQPIPRLAKRAIDLGLTLAALVFLAPLFGLLTVAVKLDSKGPAFYGHKRLGRGGRTFKAWKFRTMVQNADQVLSDLLESRPELQKEWIQDQKLRKDPRVTRLGRFLRKTSLDELPQLWNVVKGEMSLIGPRPIVEAEIPKYGPLYELYKKVRPGVSWLVAGFRPERHGIR